jgi:hypothetical protein
MSHVKTSDGYDVKVPNQGQVTYNSVAGSAGLASFLGINAQNLLNGFGWGNGWGNRNGCVSPADMPITRYEMAMQNELASKDSKIALLEANIFTDSKITETYKELRGMIAGLQDFAARQAVQNQAFSDSFRDVQKDIDYKVNLEAERRSCADCKIVNYVNSTFAPKLITDYGAGTTSAAAQVYNPLGCGCGCGCGNIYSTPAAQ